jgi:hypothetical protein
MKRLISALLFAAFAVTAAGCTATRGNDSSAQNAAASRPAPAPGSFPSGVCRTMADDVIGVWNMATGLQGHTEMTTNDRHALKARQDALIAATSAATTPEIHKSLGELVNAIGWVRLLYDTGNYQPKHMDRVIQADSAVQDSCRH